MKKWAFSKLKRTCYCHFPVFLATGVVRPKYQFFTGGGGGILKVSSVQEVIRREGKAIIGSPSASWLTLLAIIINSQNTEKGEEKNIKKQKGPGFICIEPNLRLAGRQILLEEFH